MSTLIQPVVEPFQKFIHAEAAGGILLLSATIAAMTIPAQDVYIRATERSDRASEKIPG